MLAKSKLQFAGHAIFRQAPHVMTGVRRRRCRRSYRDSRISRERIDLESPNFLHGHSYRPAAIYIHAMTSLATSGRKLSHRPNGCLVSLWLWHSPGGL